jgi:multiple sugar transport system ATP-binding protein
MNIATGTLDNNGSGPSVKLGNAKLPIPESTLTIRGLEKWVGREVAIGIRPEEFRIGSGDNADGRATPDWVFHATVSRIEALGSSIHAYFGVEARQMVSSGLVAAAGGREVFDEIPLAAAGGGATFCASLPASAQVRVGDSVELVASAASVYFFDPESETIIGGFS